MEEHEDKFTATRATLTDEWHQSRAKLDWMHVPLMAGYVNQMVSGKPLHDNGHWATYAAETFLRPLSDLRHGHGGDGRLSMVSLACGNAHIEESLRQFGWPIGRLLGLEYDSDLRRSAQDRFSALSDISSEFRFFDFNQPLPPGERFDVVFTCHSIHHSSNIELLIEQVNSLLADDGLFIGIDFFGPTRFQVEYDVRPIISELDSILPDELKRDLRYEHGPVNPEFQFPSVREVREADMSESVHSSDLRTLLFSNFDVVEIKPMGGTLLRWLFQYRAGNFRHENPTHLAIARLLQMIERTYIENKIIKSDDLFFVLKKKS